jgi:diguanylate cyclase (GGDEF)-like protein
MLGIENTNQAAFNWLASGRLVDLISTRHHAPYLARHRLAVIDTRVRFVAIAFALLAIVWIALDAATLSAEVWKFLAGCRIFIALVFMRLALAPSGEQTRARALAMLGLVLAMPLILYGVSQFLFAGTSFHGLAAVNSNLYRALPLMVLAGLSIFPLVTSEGLFFAVVIAAVAAAIQRALAGVNMVELISTLWVFILVLGVYLLACATQLNYMVTLLHRANHDPLTGALTRRSGVDVLDLHFWLACGQDRPLSVLFVGVEDFNSIDGKFGEDAGNQALKDIAAKMLALLRLSDVVIRWGDEELVVILTNTPMRGARLVVDRFIDGWHAARPDRASITLSIGLAERQTDGVADWSPLIALSRKRMHAARASGKTGYADHEGIMGATAPPAAA